MNQNLFQTEHDEDDLSSDNDTGSSTSGEESDDEADEEDEDDDDEKSDMAKKEFDDFDEIKPPEKLTMIKKFQNKVKVFVDGDHFTRGILVAILINTLSMGVEYHNQVRISLTVSYKNGKKILALIETKTLRKVNIFYCSIFSLLFTKQF